MYLNDKCLLSLTSTICAKLDEQQVVQQAVQHHSIMLSFLAFDFLNLQFSVYLLYELSMS